MQGADNMQKLALAFLLGVTATSPSLGQDTPWQDIWRDYNDMMRQEDFYESRRQQDFNDMRNLVAPCYSVMSDIISLSYLAQAHMEKRRFGDPVLTCLSAHEAKKAYKEIARIYDQCDAAAAVQARSTIISLDQTIATNCSP